MRFKILFICILALLVLSSVKYLFTSYAILFLLDSYFFSLIFKIFTDFGASLLLMMCQNRFSQGGFLFSSL